MAKLEFKEIGRVEGDSTDTVVSSVLSGDDIVGVTVSKYVKTDRYTGFKAGGIISVDDIDEVIRLMKTVKK